MSFDPHAWSWPQWTVAILYVLSLAVSASLHGRPRLDAEGEPTGWSFPVALVRFAFMVFVLIAGGFFGPRP